MFTGTFSSIQAERRLFMTFPQATYDLAQVQILILQ
jgi:hypothetical protein